MTSLKIVLLTDLIAVNMKTILPVLFLIEFYLTENLLVDGMSLFMNREAISYVIVFR